MGAGQDKTRILVENTKPQQWGYQRQEEEGGGGGGQARLRESRASNKFGHRKEMELFEIDKAARYQRRRGEAERMDVSL